MRARAVGAFGLAAMLWIAAPVNASRALAVIVDSPAYESVEEAVIAALAIALPLSRKHEFGGVIFEIAGRYYYTHPVTSHRHDECIYDAEAPAGARLAALYHTHTPHDMAGYFSAADVATAVRHGVKSYVGLFSKREIRVFDPATMRASYVFKKEHFGRISRGAVLLPASRKESERGQMPTVRSMTDLPSSPSVD
ncbi:MAG TPA: DUF4329 domain-containing protein [Steroidobacteraceae bacterium]